MANRMPASWMAVRRGDDAAMVLAAGGTAKEFSVAGDYLFHDVRIGTPCMRAKRKISIFQLEVMCR